MLDLTKDVLAHRFYPGDNHFPVFFLKYFFQLDFIMLGFTTWNASYIDRCKREGGTTHLALYQILY